MLPKISIVTPSFNQGQFIEQTIDSVLSQNYSNLEYFIIDGGSTDNTVEIIKKYSKHLTHWVSEADHGQSHAINKGLRLSTGDVFNWLNSDDYYEPNTLDFVGKQFMQKDCLVLCGRSRIFDDTGIDFFSTGTDVYKDNLAKTIGWARIDQPETFIRKQLLDQIGFVNEKLNYVMDRELWMRILFKIDLKNIYTTDAVLANFRLHANSKTIATALNFEREMDSLCHTIASTYSLHNSTKAFESSFELSSKKVNTLLNTNDQRLVSDAINYYLFKRFLESYTSNDYKNAKNLLNYIDIAPLTNEEKKQIKQITKRMNMPILFKKIFNAFKSI
ncbi:glycosyltransferase family 2 protein [Cytophaga aurantiaca]|uniref:glycosyltransferase family 2 protein n=1 Tax=Cytophaga aurantiaca TaxID=29530 RepID=UPI000382DAC8|nr:glycosyltransferase family 2 protein [Cytophaga aurantiaca]